LNCFVKLAGQEVYDKMWEVSDDAIGTTTRFGDLYNNVPDDLKDVMVTVAEFHMFPDDKREAMLTWLNRKDANR